VLAFSLNRTVSRSPIEFSARFSAHLAQAAFHRRRDAKRDARASALWTGDRRHEIAGAAIAHIAGGAPPFAFPGSSFWINGFECRSALMLLNTCMVGGPDFLVLSVKPMPAAGISIYAVRNTASK
jgi:hypothetical protein